MTIEFYCPLWGSETIPFRKFIDRVRGAGFHGVEMSFSEEDPVSRDEKTAALKAAGLKLIAQHWETENPAPEEHLAEYTRRIRFLAGANPEFINSQTGRDFFDFKDNLRILAAAAGIAEETGIPIVHETHRGKLTFAAHVTAEFLDELPQMRLTLDVSHWFCVHERFLTDQPRSLTAAISRTHHIHARIGHTQGSQVTDFRMPEWKISLEAHLNIWERILILAKSEGRERLTVTPEFGPEPYMLNAPGTDIPLADQWTMNVEMMKLLKEHWG